MNKKHTIHTEDNLDLLFYKNDLDDEHWTEARLDDVVRIYDLHKNEKTAVFRFVSEKSDREKKTYTCSRCKKEVVIPFSVYLDYRYCPFCKSRII